ncbi:MAG: DUF434 domain-containing protein, partial [Spirochaetes bacterium]|nr:DUF434 domain-containing protein [Spirochaetota bacterium]
MPRNNIITENFKNAIIDYSYLLEKDYPHKAILKIIGDRYLLTGLQRSILFRGITKKQKAFNRKSKLIYEKKVNNKMLFIDCYNVIITIVSYLSGKFIFIGNDGFLRDTAEAHGKIQKTDILEKSLILLFEYLKTLNLKDAVFFLDSPVSNSKKFANKIN